MRLLSFFERNRYKEKRCHNAKNGNFGQPLENRHRRLGKEIFLRILDEEMIKEGQAEERIKQVFCPYHAENRECIKREYSGIQKKAQHGMYSARKAEGFIGEECHAHRHGKCRELREFPAEEKRLRQRKPPLRRRYLQGKSRKSAVSSVARYNKLFLSLKR